MFGESFPNCSTQTTEVNRHSTTLVCATIARALWTTTQIRNEASLAELNVAAPASKRQEHTRRPRTRGALGHLKASAGRCPTPQNADGVAQLTP